MIRSLPFVAYLASIAVISFLSAATFAADAPPMPKPFTFRIFGMFAPEREAELKETAEKLMNVKLVSVDYAKAEATFEFDPAKAFPGAKPEQVEERLGNQLRDASHSTFQFKKKLEMPRESLQKIEIAVVGLDCKACSFAAYQAVMRLEGVEQCEVVFRQEKLTALVDGSKIDKAKIETRLKEMGLKIREPGAEKK